MKNELTSIDIPATSTAPSAERDVRRKYTSTEKVLAGVGLALTIGGIGFGVKSGIDAVRANSEGKDLLATTAELEMGGYVHNEGGAGGNLDAVGGARMLSKQQFPEASRVDSLLDEDSVSMVDLSSPYARSAAEDAQDALVRRDESARDAAVSTAASAAVVAAGVAGIKSKQK